MDAQALGDFLAPVNAALNLTSTLCLLVGYRFAKRKETRRHRRAMLGAVGASGLFHLNRMRSGAGAFRQPQF